MLTAARHALVKLKKCKNKMFMRSSAWKDLTVWSPRSTVRFLPTRFSARFIPRTISKEPSAVFATSFCSDSEAPRLISKPAAIPGCVCGTPASPSESPRATAGCN